MDQEKIGKFIAECRKKKDLTQNDLASSLGVTDKAISKWENGRCLPDLSLIKPLCKELDVTMNELINGDYIEMNKLKEKSESTLDQTITYIKKKEKKSKKKLVLALSALAILLLVFGIFVIKRYNRQTYYALDNAHILYEERLNAIKWHMDEICEKDENGNWFRFKVTSGDRKYDEMRDELVKEVNEGYKYLTANKDINLIRAYQIKGRVSKNELDYLNSINNNLTCLNLFAKYKSWWNTEDESVKKIYEKVERVYSLQEIPLYKKEKLTFPEFNAKLLDEVGEINYISTILYGEYRRSIG